MKTPRSGRLGLLGVGAVLALAVSTLAPLASSADPVPSSSSGVAITKVWQGGTSVANGANKVARLTATNTTASIAENVRVVDFYDQGLTVVGASLPVGCTDFPSPTGMGRVVCGPVDLAASNAGTTDEQVYDITFKAHYVGPAKYTTNKKVGERVDVQKAETHVSLPSKDTETFTVKCPVGYKMVDMSFVKQHVDQDTGDFDDVHIVTSDLLLAGNEWSVTLYNDADGQAQGKLWAVCVSTATNQGGTVTFTGPFESSLLIHPLAPDFSRPIYAVCDPGETPVAVDLRAVQDLTPPHPGSPYSDVLISKDGMETNGGKRTRVWVTVHQPATVTLEWQCMKTVGFGSGKRMHFAVVSGSKLVGAGEKAQLKLTCDHGYKGIVGGWNGGPINGSEPQPISRIYWFFNNTGAAKTYNAHLLCMRTRFVKGGTLDPAAFHGLVNVATGYTTNDLGTVRQWTNSSRHDLTVTQ